MQNDLKRFSTGFKHLESIIQKHVGEVEYTRRTATASKIEHYPHRLFRDSDDRLFWYFSLFRALLTADVASYNLHEGARIVPVIANLAHNAKKLSSLVNIEDKIKELCDIKNDDIDTVLFEILVALSCKNDTNAVEFVAKDKTKKSPDLCVTSESAKKYVECKKMQRGNDYSYKELDNWYTIADKLAEILKAQKISGSFDFVFTGELVGLNPSRVIRKITRKINRITSATRNFCVARNSSFRVRFTPIDKNKFNVDLDPLRNIAGPSFIQYLTGAYDIDCGYKVLANANLEGPFVSSVKCASVISWKVTSYVAIKKKAQHVKRRLVDAIKQLKDYDETDIHILVEECNGSDVYMRRLQKNIKEIMKTDLGVEFMGAIYLHIAKYIVPLDMNYDVEETVMPFRYGGAKPERIPPCWFYWDTAQKGIGTLFDDHKRN